MELNLRNYALLFVIVLTSVYFGNELRKANETLERKETDDLIQKYLLNSTPGVTKTATAAAPLQDLKTVSITEVAKETRPKLWIHMKYDTNARSWASFGSRNSTNLNQPYLHLTVKSIIQHCGNDFHICIIDDESFQHLLPDWNVPMTKINEPFLSRAREYGIACLLYKYGGMVIPNSFVCFRNLMPFYRESMGADRAFATEQVNHASIKHLGRRLSFVPDTYIMGCRSGDSTIGAWIEFLEKEGGPHFQNQTEFLGSSNRWFLDAAVHGGMTIVDGMYVGVKTTKSKPILLEELMETDELDLHPNCYGIYIPAEELLRRSKYEWYAVLPTEELLKTKPILTKYLIQAIYTNFMDDMVGAEGAMEEGQPERLKYVIPSQVGGGGI
jgi:hypothetical protein